MNEGLGEAISTLFIAGAIIAVAVILVLGLLRAGKLPPSVALVISLSMLTLVAMVGFIATINDSNSAELATLAGTGLGALAGAVTAVWGTDQQWNEKHKKDPGPPLPPLTPVYTAEIDLTKKETKMPFEAEHDVSGPDPDDTVETVMPDYVELDQEPDEDDEDVPVPDEPEPEQPDQEA